MFKIMRTRQRFRMSRSLKRLKLRNAHQKKINLSLLNQPIKKILSTKILNLRSKKLPLSLSLSN